MTILCVTTEHLPGIRPCTHRGQHRITCDDHAGWNEDLRPGACSGCFPRQADRGFLCQRCYERVEATWLKWPQFERALAGVDRAAVEDTAGVRSSSSLGYVPFTGTFLTFDECRRFLASMPTGLRALEMWVSTVDGARDAIQFAHAADRAYRDHKIEERQTSLRRVRCPKCGQLALVRLAPSFAHEPVIVACDNCQNEIREGREARLYEPDEDGGWRMTTADAVDVIEAIERRRA